MCAAMAQLKNKLRNTLDEGRILILVAQVLLGFQFRSVFEPGFEQMSRHSQDFELIGLSVMLLAIGLLIWPATYHQIVEDGEDTPEIHRLTSTVVTVAVLPFGIGLAIEFFVSAEFLFGRTQGVIAGSVTLLVAMCLWYGFELLEKRRRAAAVEKERRMSKAEESGGTELKDKIEQVLTELRVALPGAQALLGFQFSALLMNSFEKLPQSMKIVHFVSLSLVGLTVVLLMTPAAYHRIVEQGEETEHFHRFATGMLLAALVPLALGITGDFYVVARKVTDSRGLSVALAVLALIVLYGLWFGLTLARRRARRGKPLQLIRI